MKEDKLKVEKIKNGTVIDHISAGKGLDVYKILKGIEKQSIIIAINVPSTRMKRKDILKIENKQLGTDEFNHVALISPSATVVSIKNYKVIRKHKIDLPDKIKGILKCKNPVCISNYETYIVPEFSVISKDPIVLKCAYCEHEFKM
ncbi:MAG: aspartate carbamoyltransferase regulatory subunit [Candidatus Nanohalarchaeota archaeon]|nr:MAG: aspartate carbamoyltransferase regulatory subunit [Candidatus Nanohaloarchaeota archaeon]